jgi:hypothetical protein
MTHRHTERNMQEGRKEETKKENKRIKGGKEEVNKYRCRPIL